VLDGGTFSVAGDGTVLTALNASALSSGKVPSAALGPNVPLLDGNGLLPDALLAPAVSRLDGNGRLPAAAAPSGTTVQLQWRSSTADLGPGGSDTWSNPLMSITLTPRLPNSWLKVSLAATLSLSSPAGSPDPHLAGAVRISTAGSTVAQTGAFFSNEAGTSKLLPISLERIYVADGSAVTFDLELLQRSGGSVATLATTSSSPYAGPIYFEVAEIAP
jgi:hypothetical protein